jgi:hypothetical protein
MLPVRITNPATGLHVSAWGLIDTGADDCALPAAYAPLLGHRLKAGTRRVIDTGNGQTYAYRHTTRIDIFSAPTNRSRARLAYVIADTPIDFMPNLGCVLLGAASFLSHFVLKVNYPKQAFSLCVR